MSHIEKLIDELCPKGVETKSLGETAKLVRGNGMPKKVLTESGVGAIHYGQIYTRYGAWADTTISFVSPETAEKLAKVEPGDLIVTNTSENLEDVGKAVAWLGRSQIVTGGHATVIKHRFEPKFLSYWFQSRSFSTQKKALATGTKVLDVSAKQLGKIEVPVPPLPVQREIVRILDQFTELEAELEAELKARRDQYAHYFQGLLEPESRACTWKPIGDLCEVSRGRVISKDYLRENAGEYPVYSSQTKDAGIFGHIDSYDYDCESITWTTDGANAGSVFYHVGERFSITNVCGLLRAKSELVSLRYVYFQLLHRAAAFVSQGMGNPKLMATPMSRIAIPVPHREEQERVVHILDKFDALVNDLSVGLPAELNARRKQYEYYRDRLLSFEELAA